MQMERNENSILLHGSVLQAPQLSHASHGEQYLRFPLSVCRLSGTQDRLWLIAGAARLEGMGLKEGDEITVRGEVRSFNNRSGVGRRLVISVFVQSLWREQGEDENQLKLTGVLCKPPVRRRTPLGREICDMMLAVNRRYGRTDYLPCIAWGALAARCGACGVGDQLELEGRLQSRTYLKHLEQGSEERTAFEVSVMTLSRIVPRGREEREKSVFQEYAVDPYSPDPA